MRLWGSELAPPEPAESPTATINGIPSGNVSTAVLVSATLTGGTYVEVDYAWTATVWDVLRSPLARLRRFPGP